MLRDIAGTSSPSVGGPGLLPGRRRPADIFARGAAGLVPRLPDGFRPHGLAPLALDVAVVNALGESHWYETRRRSGAASTGYAAHKRARNQTATAREGRAEETRAFLHRLCGLVAVKVAAQTL